LKVLKLSMALVAGLVLFAGLAWFALSRSADRALARTFDVEAASFPIPYPIADSRIAEEGLTAEEATELAAAEAAARGERLVRARYGCTDCHGEDFGGGVMVDAAPMGRWLGPNLTTGSGSVTAGYTAGDWDRIVRHGVRPDGTGAIMPSVDYIRMSDQELGDIVTYIRSLPPVDNQVPERTFGPIATMLIATGKMELPAARLPHDIMQARVPPETAVSLEFGEHITAVCAGCHGLDFAGGPIDGDPSWPEAANLTPHPDGLAGWTADDFKRALREGVSRDGSALREPMTYVLPYAQEITDVELEAMFLYLQSLEPLPTGQ
jgi:mono/diheme cytochrome c family protein